MTTKRVTKQEKQQRHRAMKIDQGVGFSELLPLWPKHGGAHATARRVD